MAKRSSRRRFRNRYSIPEGYKEVIIDDYYELRKQMEACRKHKGYTHDVFGPKVRFRSLVCRECETKFVCTDKRFL